MCVDRRARVVMDQTAKTRKTCREISENICLSALSWGPVQPKRAGAAVGHGVLSKLPVPAIPSKPELALQLKPAPWWGRAAASPACSAASQGMHLASCIIRATDNSERREPSVS